MHYFLLFCYKDSGFMSDIWAILGKYGLSQYVRDFVNKLEFPSLRQWKQIVNKTVFQTEEQLWLHRVNNDPDFSRFCQLHDNIHIAPIYNTPLSKVLRNKNLMIFIARMWVAKPPLTRQCSSCNIHDSLGDKFMVKINLSYHFTSVHDVNLAWYSILNSGTCEFRGCHV